jgi:DNA-binding CsgD family transcriptional regulator
LKTEVEWHGYCPEHQGNPEMEAVGYNGRPFPLPNLQSRWASLEVRRDKAGDFSDADRTEAIALALVLASHHLNSRISSPEHHKALPYVRYLYQAAHQWPRSLNNQWPVLEWVVLDFCYEARISGSGHETMITNSNGLNLIREKWPGMMESESLTYWHLLNAHKRYEWALTDHRSIDALAYYREMNFHHQSLLISFWKKGGEDRSEARNEGGKLGDYWMFIAAVGAFGVMLWGWFRQQNRLRPYEDHAKDGFHASYRPESEYKPRAADANSVLNESNAVNKADWSSLWDFKLYTNEQWEEFKMNYNRCNPGFLPNLRLEYPQLTQSDIRIACLLRMGMTSNEISKVQNISGQGVAMARYRLRKRMGLGPGDCISDKLKEVGS